MNGDPRKIRVLFLCTGNACRSQMAEALLRHLAGGRFEALSAGSDYAGFVHPIALQALEHLGISTEGLRSKSWHEFADSTVDVVITLCDNAASTPCPIWPGDPIRAHWPLPDPSFHMGTPKERLEFAVSVAEQIRRKLLAMIGLPFGQGSQAELRAGLAALADT